jgi:hypothetical protein
MIMKFRRWLRNWINWIMSVEDEAENSTRATVGRRGRVIGTMSDRDDVLDGHPMRLNVYRAAGGVVIEARTYDPQRDRHHQSLHVITHDQDLATSLDKIITMESLRG